MGNQCIYVYVYISLYFFSFLRNKFKLIMDMLTTKEALANFPVTMQPTISSSYQSVVCFNVLRKFSNSICLLIYE